MTLVAESNAASTPLTKLASTDRLVTAKVMSLIPTSATLPALAFSAVHCRPACASDLALNSAKPKLTLPKAKPIASGLTSFLMPSGSLATQYAPPTPTKAFKPLPPMVILSVYELLPSANVTQSLDFSKPMEPDTWKKPPSVMSIWPAARMSVPALP